MPIAYRFEAYFQALELDPAATLEEVKQAYRDLLLVWHPDRFSNNPRLQQKAEEKIKFFNQAYEQLKLFYTQVSLESESRPCSPPSSPPGPGTSRPKQSAKTSAHGNWTCSTSSDLTISLGEAKYILGQYTFQVVRSHQNRYQCYEGGPFQILTCASPLEFQLSVPCESLQSFDRILLSIPCKSKGQFWQSDARTLIDLLQQHLEN